MTQMIHYDDSIFFLADMIKTLKNGLSLDIHSDFFIDRIVSDIEFIHNLLHTIAGLLKGNTQILGREDSLRHLSKTTRAFVSVLTALKEGKIGNSLDLSPFFPLYDTMIDSYKPVLSDIRVILTEADDSDGNTELVSQEEFKFLLMTEESDERPPE
ncbi:MAG TPA: hypothetical protein PLG43_03955 [Spirochaetia bacterium]|nr:hypothetical protein [Spirochaetia bacterium]